MYIISNVANRRIERSTMGMRANDQFSDVAARWLSIAMRCDFHALHQHQRVFGQRTVLIRRRSPSAIAAGDSSVILLV